MSKHTTPKEVILERLDAFAAAAPDRIYTLYSIDSDFVRFFPTYEIYLKQYKKLTREHEVVSINIIREDIFNERAEVLYEERFRYADEIKIFYCKARLIKENDEWKIWYDEKESRG